MNLSVDFHIHSCLSPCADNDMTPNNIINMAVLKGLDAIAVTDHNSGKNISSVISAAKGKKIVVLPGIEVQSKEEVHLLCYFPSLREVSLFDAILYKHLPAIRNNSRIFGNQFICNAQDTIVAQEEKLLLNAVDLSINEIVSMTRAMNGITIPAHVDRHSNSIISNLGFIPEELEFSCIEASENLSIIQNNSKKYTVITSSDAHRLGDISERSFYIQTNEFSLKGIFDFLMHPIFPNV